MARCVTAGLSVLFLLIGAGCADTKSSLRDSTGAGSQTQATPATTSAASPARKRDKLEGIPLEWTPTSELPKGRALEYTGTGPAELQIDPFTDTREDPSVLGQNRERKVSRKVTTPDNVAAFVTDKVKMLIRRSGFYVVDSGGTAILKADIKSFSVDETDTYNGDVSLAVSVTSPSGELRWQGLAEGHAQRFGHSYREDNYFETLSDSLIDAVHDLVEKPGFRKAVGVK